MKAEFKKPYVSKGKSKKGAAAKAVAPAHMTAKALVKEIKQISAKTALKEMETKFVRLVDPYPVGVTFNSAIVGTGECYSLIPAVTQGTGDWQRVNNDLTPVNIKTVWHVGLTATTRSCDIVAVIYCLMAKDVKSFPLLAQSTGFATGGSSGPYHLKTGDSNQVQPFLGRPSYADFPIAIENFTLLKKFTVRLSKNVGYANDDDVTSTYTYPVPNNGHSYKRLEYTYPCKQQLRYTPAVAAPGGDFPTSHAPFWCAGYYHTDGSPADVLQQDLVISWTTTMTYKDA